MKSFLRDALPLLLGVAFGFVLIAIADAMKIPPPKFSPPFYVIIVPAGQTVTVTTPP